ncbi:MAG: HpcH/HpaI aldolase/citrate lyase family protein [Burkholderiaceae bacterium]|nr:HpcH/HpaI aldolase/citrate lyase family protein [Microbacteriaceae bacterium]
MKLLVLGGTEFVGRALVDDALARGWEVTVFHRGTEPIPGVASLQGDRTESGGLAVLAAAVREGAGWDIVADTWSHAPSAVRDTARLLAGHAGGYIYISSRSVYAYPTAAGADERAPVVAASADGGEDDYATMKAGGELAATAEFGDRALLVRAGLILGPHENIGRLPWWLGRLARGGTVLAPGPADLPIQYIDARDLAAWALSAAERGLGGAFNVVSPVAHSTMGEILETIARVVGASSEPRLRWTDPDDILAAGVAPWTELPFWIPPGEAHDTMHRADVGPALATGLAVRPLAETVADTWAWLQSIGGVAPQRADRPRVGLALETEARVLGITREVAGTARGNSGSGGTGTGADGSTGTGTADARELVRSAITALFVPGDRPDRFAKAATSAADIVIIDLEDAVARGSKADALAAAVAGLLPGGVRALVRVNTVGSPTFTVEVDELLTLARVPGNGLLGLMVPKADGAAGIAALAARLEPRLALVPLIESAKGVQHAFAIASVPGVTRVAFGAIDFAFDIDASGSDASLDYARGQVVVASRAAEIGSPLDSPTTDIRDLDIVAAAAARARTLGFGGKLCIHPAQVAVVAAQYEPTEREVAWATRVLSVDDGVAQVDGRMVDRPVIEQARRILHRAR